jgi:arylsulfatase A-like enzyme
MKPNIILILLDGARWDRLHTSDNFNEIKKDGFLMNNVSTTIPYTIGSINSLFSGLYGKENGVDAYYKVLGLKNSVKILPELLQENGYYTACDLLHKKIIADRGFDIHQAHDEYKDDLFLRHPEFLINCFQQAYDKPLFCFLHFTKIHTITVSEVLEKYEWDDDKFYENKINNLKKYDDAFFEAATYIQKILESIKYLQKLDDTIIIIFSDHGTGIGERYGERNYGLFTYDETIRTFFHFIGPEIQKNKLSDSLYSNIDILPTILDLVNINNDFSLIGSSFAKFLKENSSFDNERKFTFSETGALHGPFPSPEKPNVFCIKTKKYKLMYLKTPEQWKLYDLEQDPAEEKNLFGSGIFIQEELKNELIKWIDRN